MNANLYRNGSLIPSREEKRAKVKWKAAWSNLQLVKAVTAQEKFFMFQVQQDILPVGSRMHRPGAEKRCLAMLDNNRVCLQHNDRLHAMLTCQRHPVKDRSIISILSEFLGRPVTDIEVIHFSFNHRNKNRLRVPVWFAVKTLYFLYLNKCENNIQLMDEIRKEIDWNLKMKKGLGPQSEVLALKNALR